MSIKQSVTLYMGKNGAPPKIYAVQNDTGRILAMSSGDQAFSSSMTAKLSFKRSDATYYSVDCDFDGTTEEFTANIEQALTQAGTTIAHLKVTESEKLVSTFLFYIEVQADVSGYATKQEQITVEKEVAEAKEAAKDAASAKEDAENAAETAAEKAETATAANTAAQSAKETAVSSKNAAAESAAAAANTAQLIQSSLTQISENAENIDALIAATSSSAETNSEYHLGFYRDEDGDLCEVDE